MPSTTTLPARVGRMSKILGGLGLLVVLLLGVLIFVRPTTVSTGPDQVALHYSDGAFTPRRYEDCVQRSTRAWDGPGDKHYLYPTSQRNYVFGEASLSDATKASLATLPGDVEIKVFSTPT